MERLVKAILELVENKSIDSKTASSLIEELKNSFSDIYKTVVPEAGHREIDKEDGKIAVIGMALRFPQADNPEVFWDNLEKGKDCISEFPSERCPVDTFYSPEGKSQGMSYSKWGGFINDADKFATAFFKIDKAEAECIDPQQRVFLEIALEAFHRAGYSKKQLSNSRTSVIVGARSSTYNTSDDEFGTPKKLTGNITNFIAARVSDFFNLKGSSYVIDTACSSSLVAIHNACNMLNKGECDMALAGGIDLKLTPVPYLTLSDSKALSIDGKCYSFDKRADGFVPGEGGGAVLLKPLEKALKDGDIIYGIISGSSVNNDGHTMGITTPNYDGQKDVLRQAYKNAKIDPSTISYVEAHGTGTLIGDPIEIKALTEIFREYTDKKGYCAIGSVKTNIGHLDTASGVAGFIKVILSLYNKKIVPTLNCEMPNPRLNFLNSPFYPVTSLQNWEPVDNIRRAAISSFGFGGTNCHIVLEEYIEKQKTDTEAIKAEQVLMLSAENVSNLQKLAYLYRTVLENKSSINLQNFLYTANTAREMLAYRTALCVRDKQDTIDKLKLVETNEIEGVNKLKYTSENSFSKASVAMVFPGQGSHYIGMAEKLYHQIPVFKKAFDACNAIASEILDRPLIDIIYQKENEELLNQTCYTQPALFSICYSLAQVWIKSGIRPKAVIGHSVGEYVAACISGILTLEDAIKLICIRGNLIQSLPLNGGMIVIFLPHHKVLELIHELSADEQNSISIAAINSPSNTVISCELKLINKLINLLSGRGIRYTKLAVSHAFHSILMNPIVEEFGKVLGNVSFNTLQIPLVQNVTGKLIKKGTLDKEYWQNHLMQTVMFEKSINTATENGINIFLEVGPGTTASSMIKDILKGRDGIRIITSLNKNKEDLSSINSAVAELFTLGLNPDYSIFRAKKPKTELVPVCPLEREKCWIEQYKGKECPKASLQDEDVVEIINEFNPVVRDHVVNGVKVFPGVALWEVVIRNTAKKFGKNVAALKQIKHITQLELKDGNSLKIKIIYEGIDDPGFKVMYTSDNKNDWKLCAGGSIEFGDSYNGDRIDLNNLIDNLRKSPVSVDELYGKFNSKGVVYGRTFRSIEQLWANEDSVIAKLKLSEAEELVSNNNLYYPNFVDGALQSVIGLKEKEESKNDTFIPFLVNKVSIQGSLQSEGYSYLKITRNSKEVITADIQITDTEGNVKITIQGHSFKKLNTNINMHSTDKSKRNGYFYIPKFVEKECSVSGNSNEFSVLILSNHDSFFDGIVKHLKELNFNTIRCIKGKEFRRIDKDTIEMDFNTTDNFNSMFNSMYSEGVQTIKIINFLPKTNIDYFSRERDGYYRSSEETVTDFVSLLKAIETNKTLKVSKILTVSTDCLNKNNLFETFKAVISGFVKTAAKEYPNIKMSLLNTDTCTTSSLWLIIDELKSESNDLVVKYKNQKRFIQTIEQISSQPATSAMGKIKKEGTYLITGGLNGLGFSIAQIISQKYGADLILVGKSEFPDRKEWDSYLQGTYADDNFSNKIKAIKTMEENGSKVRIFNVDVTYRYEVETLFDHLGDNPKIDGIFHLAGVIRDSLIRNKNAEDVNKVLSPKIQGSVNIVETFKRVNPSFIVFFSSIASFFGSIGQSDYAAANSFMDDYADFISKNLGIPAISINWTLWDAVGMGVRSGHADAKKSIGMQPFNIEDGYEALEEILGLNVSQVIALNNSIEEMALPTVTPSQEIKNYPQESLKETQVHEIDYVDLEFVIEDELISKISEILDISKKDINIDVNFMELGLDSISIVDFTSWVADRIKAELYPTLLFEYSTIKDFSQYLVSNHADCFKKLINETKEIKTSIEVIEAVKEEQETKSIQTDRPKPDQNQQQQNNAVAIIGFAGMFPGAKNVDEYWEILKNGVNSVTALTEEKFIQGNKDSDIWGGFLQNAEYFEPLFFNVSPKEAIFVDPQQRLFLETAWNTLDMAGYSSKRLNNQTVGVYVGASQVEYKKLCENSGITSPYMGLGNSLCVIANRVSYLLNLKGPSLTVDSACSSSLVALDIAYNAIVNKQVDMAIAGGVQLYFSTDTFEVFKAAGMLAKDGKCKTFDEKADGYVRGEGVGAVLLKPLNRAIEDGDNIYAVINGIAVNHDGNDKVGISAPNPNAQKQVILEAIKRADINPQDISHVEAHGTGTALGDPVEIKALTQAYREYTDKNSFCAISTAKSIIGHLESSSGIAGLIKTVLMFKNKMLPPTINFNKINPHIPFNSTPFYINDKLRPWDRGGKKKYASVSSFGFGGTNCHVILSDYETISRDERDTVSSTNVLAISAKTLSSLNAIIRDLEEYIDKNPYTKLKDLCFSMNTGRDSFDYKACFVADSISSLREKLKSVATKGVENSPKSGEVFYHLNTGKSSRFAVVLGNTTKIDMDLLLNIKKSDNLNLLNELNKIAVNFSGDSLEKIIEKKNYHSAVRIMSFISTYVIIKTLKVLGLEPSVYVTAKSQLMLAAVLTDMVSLETALEALIKDDSISMEIGSKKIRVIEDRDIDRNEVVHSLLSEARVDKVFAIGWRNTASDDYQVMDITSLSIPETLARAYLSGLEPDWIKYYQGDKYNRLILPMYPFERKRYCIDSVMEANNNVTNNDVLIKKEPVKKKNENSNKLIKAEQTNQTDKPNSLFRYTWKKAEEVTMGDYELKNKKIIVFGNRENESKAFLEALAKNNLECILVEASDSFREITSAYYQLNPMVEDNYTQLFEAVLKGNSQEVLIVHMWNVSHNISTLVENTEEIEKHLSLGLYSIFFIGKAIHRYETDIRLLFVTDCTHNLFKEKNVLSAIKYSSCIGLESLTKENQRIKAKSLDIDGQENDSDFIANYIFHELKTSDFAPEQICCSGGIKYVRQLEKIQDILPGSHEEIAESFKVIMIVGGASGLGLRLAKYYLQKYHCKIIIVGRTELSNSDYSQEAKKRSEELSGLVEAGYSVEYICTDVTSYEAVEQLSEHIRLKFGELDGIINCAGVIEDALVVNKDFKSFKKVISPKIFGSYILDKLVPVKKSGFFIMMSSLASVEGNPGQIDYSAANAFMDYYAFVGDKEVRKVSINLPFVLDGGMKVDSKYIKLISQKGLGPIKSQEVIQAINTILPNLNINNAAVLPANNANKDSNHIKGFLKTTLSKLLFIEEEQIDINLDFSNFGLDSLIIGDTVKAIEDYLGEAIPHSVFMEHSSINKLTEYLCKTHKGKMSFLPKTQGNKIAKPDIKQLRMNILRDVSNGAMDRAAGLEALLNLEGRGNVATEN